MLKVDMSAAAVTTRLKRVSQLRKLCLSLASARVVQEEAKKGETKGTADTSSKSPKSEIK
jgi:hypothetical protein